MTSSSNHYAQHLAAVNDRNSVVATEDIYNTQGALVIKKGTDLTVSKAKLISQHKLVKPLEQSVDISKSLNAREFYKLLEKLSENLPGLYAVTQGQPLQSAIKYCCQCYQEFPLLRQKLTVLHSELQEVYFHSLFCAVAGLTIALKMECTDNELETVFLASLMREVGLLHLPKDLVIKKDGLTEEESRLLQSHTAIGKHFLDLVPGLSKAVGRAVFEHHERTDGTGYPSRKFGDVLGFPGQIIAITDVIIRSHNTYKQYGDHTHQLIFLVLQLNDTVHFESVYKAAAVLFQQGPMPKSVPPSGPKPEQLLKRQKLLKKQFSLVQPLTQELLAHAKGPIVPSIGSMQGRLAVSINSSGILQLEHEQWLKTLQGQSCESDGLDLLKISVMHDEIDYQLILLMQLFWEIIQTIPPSQNTLKECVNNYYKQLSSLQNG